MQENPEFRALIEETQISVEAALALTDIISQHEIVQSTSFNQLIVFLSGAADLLAAAKMQMMMQSDKPKVQEALPQNRGVGRAALRVVSSSN